ELVPGVVQVHQVDPAGDGLHPVDDADQLLTGGEGVARVQAEPRVELADRVPQPGEHVELAGHRVVAARGVLDQDRQREAAVGGRSAVWGWSGGFFQDWGSPRKNCTASAPRSSAAPRGSSSRTWAPMRMASEPSRRARQQPQWYA